MPLASMDDLVAALAAGPVLFGKDAATAEAAGIMHTPWYGTGVWIPAGAAPTGGLNGATISNTAGLFTGAIPMPAAVAGRTTYLHRWSMQQANNMAGAWLIDRQWGNVPVVTTTGAQAVTSPTWVSRDDTGSTNGVRVMLALECSSATGNGAPITNTTVSYTNSAGTAGRTATLASFPSTAVAGTWVPFTLAAGDGGVKSVQSITLGTSYVSGQVHLTAWRFINSIALPTVNAPVEKPFTATGLPAVWDGSVLQLVYMTTGTALGATYGDLTYAQG